MNNNMDSKQQKWLNRIAWLIVFGCLLSVFNAARADGNWYSQDVWQNPERAFQWYPDPRAKQTKPEEQQQQTAPVANELVQFELLQKQLDEARKIAIMSPTEANLKRYITLQEFAMNQSAAFTDQWQRVIWQNPDLDYSQRGRPTSALAIQNYDAARVKDKAAAIRQLAAQHGVLFIYRSDCPYCHAMSPIVRRFADTHGIKVMPVSLDGGPLPDFPQFLPNNGIAEKLQVTTVPALYVMDTQTKQFKPLGFGVMAESTLADRFLTYTLPVGAVY